MSRIFVEQMGATRSDAVLIYRARNIGEDAVSTTIGKQLATIRRRLFDRVDRPSMEAAKIKRGGRNGARSTEKGGYFRRTTHFRLDFRGFEMNVIRVNAGGEETVQSVGDPVIIEGFRVSRVEEYRSKVN